MASQHFDTLEVRELIVSDKSAFTAATNPIARQAGAAQAALAAYATGAFGLNSDANMLAMYNLVVEIRQCLVDSGLIKGAA
jgi:hypothetical protein